MNDRTAIPTMIHVQNLIENGMQAQNPVFSTNNLPFSNALVTDFNRIVDSGNHVVSTMRPQQPAPFGTHLREAASIVKDWVQHP